MILSVSGARRQHCRISTDRTEMGALLAARRNEGMSALAKIPPGVGPKYPQVVVLVGATGDLSQRKLLPGLFHLCSAGFIPACRIIGVSLDAIDVDGFRAIARGALDKFSGRKVDEADWAAFAAMLDYVPMAAGPEALRAAAEKAERDLGGESRRVHYLSVPPAAALSAVRLLAEAGLSSNARGVITGSRSAPIWASVPKSAERARLHEVFAGRPNFPHQTISWARSRRRTSWRSASPTACSSRSGTATSSITYRSTCRRRWAWARAPRSTRRPAPIATWW